MQPFQKEQRDQGCPNEGVLTGPNKALHRQVFCFRALNRTRGGWPRFADFIFWKNSMSVLLPDGLFGWAFFPSQPILAVRDPLVSSFATMRSFGTLILLGGPCPAPAPKDHPVSPGVAMTASDAAAPSMLGPDDCGWTGPGSISCLGPTDYPNPDRSIASTRYPSSLSLPACGRQLCFVRRPPSTKTTAPMASAVD